MRPISSLSRSCQLNLSPVTGASSGFGRELSKIVLKNGELVVAAARRTHLLDDLVAQYSADRILVVKTDVTQPQDISDCFAQALNAFGHIDVVFNNAGYADDGEVESMPDAQARGIMETNFWGAVSVTREAVKCFRESNPQGTGGCLLQMSSMYGVGGTSCGAFYTASKHGQTSTTHQSRVTRLIGRHLLTQRWKVSLSVS